MDKVIYDTDPGVDDALALLYLLRHPGIDLLGVTTVFGNAPVAVTTRNARFLLRAWGAAGVPVHAGADAALEQATPPDEDFPAHIHGANGLGDYPIPDPVSPVTNTAVDFLIDQIRAHPGQVRVLAVGRMTNLAQALRQAPDIAGLVRDVVIMGGAFGVPGNITPAAEANIFGDPLAADEVFGAGWPVVAVPLNVTRQTVMTRGDLAALSARGGADFQMVADLSQGYIDFYHSLGAAGMLVHDCTAAVYLTDPGLFSTQTGRVRVVAGGIATGQTIVAPSTMGFPPGDWDRRPNQTFCHDGEAEAILARIAGVCVGG